MKSRIPLKSRYESYLSLGNGNEAYLTELFKRTLSIPDVSTKNLLEELKTLKSTRCTDFDRINRIYESIDRIRLTITGTAVENLK
jgi:hypothetical protein